VVVVMIAALQLVVVTSRCGRTPSISSIRLGSIKCTIASCNRSLVTDGPAPNSQFKCISDSFVSENRLRGERCWAGAAVAPTPEEAALKADALAQFNTHRDWQPEVLGAIETFEVGWCLFLLSR
jgi:hypothetical protein